MSCLAHIFSTPGVPGFLTGICIFVFVFAVACLSIKAGNYNPEHAGAGSFEPILSRYMRLVEFIVGLATGSIVLLAGSSVLHSKGNLPPVFGSPMAMLAMSTVFLVLFIAFTTYFYEDWLHQKKNRDSDGTDEKKNHGSYRLTTSLGFAGLLCFAVGYCWLAFALVRIA